MADRATKPNRRRIYLWVAAWVGVLIVGAIRFWRSVSSPDSTAERPITDCIGTLERPGCGSASRGGPYQLALLVFLLLAFAFIAWRIWVGSKKARSREASSRAGDQA